MHIDGFVRGKGKFVLTEYVPTDEKVGPRFPLLLTTGRILASTTSAPRPGAPTNVLWHEEDRAGDPPARRRGTRYIPVDGPPVLLKNVNPDHHHWVELKLVSGEPANGQEEDRPPASAPPYLRPTGCVGLKMR